MNMLIQHGYGPATELLDITQKYHHAWCARHGWMMREDRDQKLAPIMVHFEKWRVMSDGLHAAKDGALVVYLDADTVITDQLDDALPDGYDLGATEWIFPRFNSGALYWRANPISREFCDGMAKLPEDASFQHFVETTARFRDLFPDEPVFNKFLKASVLNVLRLDNKFNGKSYMLDLRVMAFHGTKDDYAKTEMKNVVREVQEMQQWRH